MQKNRSDNSALEAAQARALGFEAAVITAVGRPSIATGADALHQSKCHARQRRDGQSRRAAAQPAAEPRVHGVERRRARPSTSKTGTSKKTLKAALLAVLNQIAFGRCGRGVAVFATY